MSGGRVVSLIDGGYGDSFFVRDFTVAFVIVLLLSGNIFAVRGEGSVEVAGGTEEEVPEEMGRYCWI